MSNDHKVTSRSHTFAKHLRELNREEMFKRARQSTYLDSYNSVTKNMIKESLEGLIPNPLPPVSVTTISYYRRSNRPVFKTKSGEGQPFEPHMTYQSLWLLAGIEEIENFPNLNSVIKEFEEDLPNYLNFKFKEIREMAIIAAGNKILGKPEDILRIVENDEEQLWVLINHIYERKICFTKLYKFLNNADGEIVYRTIFQMTNNHKDQIIQSIMSNEQVLAQVIDSLRHEKPEIQSYAVRILGNILAEKEEYSYDFMKFHILDHLYPLLKSSNDEVRKDTCWTVSNYAYEKGPATDIICNPKFIEKLLMMFKKKEKIQIKKELYYAFCHLVENAEKKKIYQLVIHENILNQCLEDLYIEDVELNKLTLYFIIRVIELGEHFVVSYEEDSQNFFGEFIRNSPSFRQVISEKSYSQNNQINESSFQIMDRLNMLEDG